MNKALLSIIGILLIGFVISSGCNSLVKEPVITVKSVDLVGITPTDLTMSVTLNIDNPNFMGVTIDILSCNIEYLDGNNWVPLTQITRQNVEIKKGENTLTFTVQMKNADLIKAGFSGFKSGQISLKIEGTAQVSFFGISSTIPFSKTEIIPIGQPTK